MEEDKSMNDIHMLHCGQCQKWYDVMRDPYHGYECMQGITYPETYRVMEPSYCPPPLDNMKEALIEYVMHRADSCYSDDFPIHNIEHWIREFFDGYVKDDVTSGYSLKELPRPKPPEEE